MDSWSMARTSKKGKNNGTSMIPNLDSIEEFRIITNNFDAEYGNYSGGQVNVVTKSGTNSLHGSVFEFNRNTAFNARNFFSPAGDAPKLIQNQFGATVGGPIKRDKLFFFVDYQGTRRIFAPTVAALFQTEHSCPTATTVVADRNQQISQRAQQTRRQGYQPPVAVQGQQLATNLSSALGYAVNVRRTVLFHRMHQRHGCDPCVFPNAIFPRLHFRLHRLVCCLLFPVIPATVPVNGPNFFRRISIRGFATTKVPFAWMQTRSTECFRPTITSTRYVVNPYPNSGATVPAPNIGAFTATDLTRAQVLVLATRSLSDLHP